MKKVRSSPLSGLAVAVDLGLLYEPPFAVSFPFFDSLELLLFGLSRRSEPSSSDQTMKILETPLT